MLDLTVDLCTKGRYDTTLASCLFALANQTEMPKRIVICDDNEEPIDMRKHIVLGQPWNILMMKGVCPEVIFTKGQGQVKSHQLVLDIAETKRIFRVDDDVVLEHNTLASLWDTMDKFPGCPAAAPLIINPSKHTFTPPIVATKISQTLVTKYAIPNVQWFPVKDGAAHFIPTEHLYSSFMYDTIVGKKVKYPNYLSKIGHREETIFSHGLFKRAGIPCYVNTQAITYHYHCPNGGIRSYYDGQMWANDETRFREVISACNIKPAKIQFFVLDNGLGDHFVFLDFYNRNKERFKDYTKVIACCYPEVFESIEDIVTCSIADAYGIYNINPDTYNIYRHMRDNGWISKMVFAYEDLYDKEITN